MSDEDRTDSAQVMRQVLTADAERRKQEDERLKKALANHDAQSDREAMGAAINGLFNPPQENA